MFIPGLVSITYRPLTPAQLIALTRTAGLSAIEWGGDVHVPHGNTGAAARVGGMTRGAGLDTISYGTYYKAGTYGSAYADTFAAMLDTADALGAPNLRLWAGGKNSQDVTADERAAMTAELKVCAKMAAGRGKTISFEFHNNTLTNTAASAKALIEEIGEDNAVLYWQPNQFLTHEENCAGLSLVLPYVTNVHVFAWLGHDRFALAEHRSRWSDYLNILASSHRNHGLLMEFTPHDDPAEFVSEAETLLSWL